MTLEEKVGQLFMVGVPGEKLSSHFEQMLTKYYIGGVILYESNLKNPKQIAELCNSLQKKSKIPLLISTDQEGGNSQTLYSKSGFTETCGNMALGATRDYKNAYLSAKIMAKELKAVGINMVLAPVVDVNCNPDNPIINIRSFGEDPEFVSKMGKEMVKGFQEEKVLATIKHFPGHGDTTVDSHKGLPKVDFNIKRLEKVELRPFSECIKAGTGAIMTAHIIYNAFDKEYPATLSEKILTNFLREKLKFKGIIITDGMEMEAIAQNYGIEESTILSINAGADIVLVCTDNIAMQKRRIESVINAVKEGKIKEEKINNAVRRILKIKNKFVGENPYVDLSLISKKVGTKENLMTSLKIAQKSITILKNKDNLIPLKISPSDEILIVSPKIDTEDPTTSWRIHATTTLGKEIGKRHPTVSEILINSHPDVEEINLIKKEAKKSKIIIIATLNARFSKEQIALVKEISELNKPLIGVSISMPYDFINLKNYVHSFIASYCYREPSLKAVVDVLFGNIEAKGTLPVGI